MNLVESSYLVIFPGNFVALQSYGNLYRTIRSVAYRTDALG